ncbi:autotransporter outer membrane beta-barrel domain-containing protein [Pantoea sp. BAV 3049]|uniref:autotransporter outer membrane beta-barrel domain-containing protein n=1 Tax=Pantoea sp. BAV 3049 TaxID=2654188 RepID=UPI00351BAA2E
MDTSYTDENARLRAQLQEQQATLRKMAEYNRLLSQRVAAYASEINRLKALVAMLQRMQVGKSSEKLREKTARQVREAEERIGALLEEMLGEQHGPVLPQPLRQSSARKPLPGSLPRETATGPEGIQVVEVDGNSDGTFTQGGRGVAGAYDYRRQKGNTSDSDQAGWYLTSYTDILLKKSRSIFKTRTPGKQINYNNKAKNKIRINMMSMLAIIQFTK